MIRVIDRANCDDFRVSLDQQFRLRREVFVEECGWKEFDRGDYETDQYDTADAIYVVSIDPNENVLGGFRLYPTELPHMLSEVFSSMVEGPILQRSDVLELTRLAIAAPARNSKNYCELFLGLLEYGLSEGISGTTALIRTLRIPIVQSVGMKVIPLGLPKDIDGEMLTAVLFEIDEESLTRVRKSAGVFTTVIEDRRHPVRRIAS
jgi:acyl-homoserine lactone synthase